jgi:hypothetical protein
MSFQGDVISMEEYSRGHTAPKSVKLGIENDVHLSKFPDEIKLEAVAIFNRLHVSGMKERVKKKCLLFSVYSAYKNLHFQGYDLEPRILTSRFELTMKDFNQAREQFSETKTGIPLGSVKSTPKDLLGGYCDCFELNDEQRDRLSVVADNVFNKKPEYMIGIPRAPAAGLFHYFLTYYLGLEVKDLDFTNKIKVSMSTVHRFSSEISAVDNSHS